MKKQVIDLNKKKQPMQRRSLATVEAIIQAAAQILSSNGYAELTTNAIAQNAGVSIGSLYEYYPGKEAIVADVVTREINGMVQQLISDLDQAMMQDFEAATRHWIQCLYNAVEQRQKLIKVLIFEVPFINEIPAFKNIRERAEQLVIAGAQKTTERYQVTPSPTSLYLITNLTVSTLLQLVLAPHPFLETEKVLDELSFKVNNWLTED